MSCRCEDVGSNEDKQNSQKVVQEVKENDLKKKRHDLVEVKVKYELGV